MINKVLCGAVIYDALVKIIRVAELKVSCTRRSDFSDKKSYM
jgi:hypothetical protein